MGALVPFAYGDSLVRVVEVNAAPWWVAGDVAKVLGYREARDMCRNLDDDEQLPHIVRGLEGERDVSREVTIISESGLYHAIIKSRRPEAKRFRKWVTSEVLPAIRQNGFYAVEQRSAEVTAATDPWAMLDQRLGHLERLIAGQAMVESTEFARAISYAPAVLCLEHDDGRLRRQRRPRWWFDIEVREGIIARHRQMTINRAIHELVAEFGENRAPSRSSLGRVWQQLDHIRAVSRRTH